MDIHRIAVLAAGLLLALPSTAIAFPNSYALEHPAFCAEAWAKRAAERVGCGSQKFCAAHKNDDRISRIVCDPYVSHADRRLPAITLSRAWLDSVRDLTPAESRTQCPLGGRPRCAVEMVREPDGLSLSLVPGEMKSAKLALRADLSVYTFATTVIRLGIASANRGVLELTWSPNLAHKGPRKTESTRLTAAEIDRILKAINRSDFWRLPHNGTHNNGTDGLWAGVEVSVAGWKDEATDSIGDGDAPDLSILVNELTLLIRSRWKDVPV